MAERKVLVKYFPKNFDPERLVKRGRGKDRLMNVRNMLPMSLRCNTCSNYLYIGTKFNMRMEICNDEMYLGIKIFRFYLKCTFCYAEITFKTDPKNHDYVVETGGTRNYDPYRDALQAENLIRKLKLDEEEGNSMKSLENKTYDSKREMELMEVLDEIKNENKRQSALNPEELLKRMFEEELKKQMFTEEEEEEIDQSYQMKKKQLNEDAQVLKVAGKPTVTVSQQPKKDAQGFRVPVRKIKRSKHNDEIIQRLTEKADEKPKEDVSSAPLESVNHDSESEFTPKSAEAVAPPVAANQTPAS